MNAPHAPRLRDHWWTRPGWRPGRVVLTWHLTFAGAAELHRLAAGYQRALDGLPGLRPQPVEWLHATLQAVGYADELSPTEVDAVTRAVRRELSGVAPFALTVHRPRVYAEAVVLPAEPAGEVREVVSAVRRGIAAARGAAPAARAGTVGAHVSVAYAHAEADTVPHVAALDRVAAGPVTVPVDAVAFIRQERQLAPHWRYRWDVQATAPLTGRRGRRASPLSRR